MIWHLRHCWKPVAVNVVGLEGVFRVTIVLYGCTKPGCVRRRVQRYDGEWKLEHFEQVNEASKTGGNNDAIQSGTDTAGKT